MTLKHAMLFWLGLTAYRPTEAFGSNDKAAVVPSNNLPTVSIPSVSLLEIGANKRLRTLNGKIELPAFTSHLFNPVRVFNAALSAIQMENMERAIHLLRKSFNAGFQGHAIVSEIFHWPINSMY